MRPVRSLAAVLALLAASAGAAAAQIPPPPAATPVGLVRVAGPVSIRPLAEAWAAEFTRRHPGIRVELDLQGSDVAMAQLYTGQVDVALLGREAAEMEAKAFEWIYRYPPTRTPVASGSLDRPGRSPALAVIVHRDNPLVGVSLPQLAALFGDDPRWPRARTWGDLGLGGPWRSQPVRLYGPEAESGTGRFFRASVLSSSNKLAWDALTEFGDPPRPDHAPDTAGAAVVEAVAEDVWGIGLGLPTDDERVRVLGVAKEAGHAAVDPTRASVASGDYPLGRTVYAYFNQPPEQETDAETKAFLDFVTSAAGQARIKGADGYLPRTAAR